MLGRICDFMKAKESHNLISMYFLELPKKYGLLETKLPLVPSLAIWRFFVKYPFKKPHGFQIIYIFERAVTTDYWQITSHFLLARNVWSIVSCSQENNNLKSSVSWFRRIWILLKTDILKTIYIVSEMNDFPGYMTFGDVFCSIQSSKWLISKEEK